jgi:TP901 family phage tail tape measure protein
MAKVAGDSASEVSQQLTAVWNNFAKGGENLTKFADSMTALGAATASSTKEISDGLEKFASVADTVGLSFDYAAAALATITATTRASADTVGTSLKTLFARIQDLEMGKTLDDGTTLGKYSQTLKAVGIDIKGANGELKDMDDILSEMGAKWKTLTKDEQVALAQGVAGTREYAQLVALMDNWDFMKQNLETSKNAAGTLAEQAKIYEESWRAASDRVKAAAEGLFDDLINDEFFIDLLNGAEKLLDIVKSLVQSLGGVEGVLATISTYVLTIARTKIADELKRITGPSQKTKEMEAMNTKKEANNAFKTILGKSDSQEDKIRADNYKRIYEI